MVTYSTGELFQSQWLDSPAGAFSVAGVGPYIKRAAFAVYLALLATGNIAAAASNDRPWFARVWQSDEGLPDNTVVGVEQTLDGFLWVATQAGLVRFDGIRFQQFAPVATAGVPSNLIESILVDSHDRLWVAKDKRTVVCVDHGRTQVFTPENSQVQLEARMMVEDSEGGIWVSYIGGDVMRIKDGGVRSFTVNDGLRGGTTCQLAPDRNGQLWFAEDARIGVFRNDRFSQLSTFRAQRITAASSGGIWICTGLQLFKFTEGEPLKIGELPAPLPNVNPTVLHEDREGRLWIGTREAGLFVYTGAGFRRVVTSHHEILSLKEDREGNLWVGTGGGGLNRLKHTSVELVSTDPRTPLQAVRSLCQDSHGTVWAVAQDGVVSHATNNSWLPLSADAGWSISYAECVSADPGGGLWIGTQYKGLHHWQNGVVDVTLSRSNGLFGDFVHSLLATRPGEIWIGSESADGQKQGLQRWRSGRLTTFTLPRSSGRVTAIVRDPDGDCWAGTAGGFLLRAHDTELIDETRNTLASPQPIRCLLATAEGTLWIGYAGEGVGRLQKEIFNVFRADQGLHDDYISQIVQDDHARLWFAGNRGIFYVREQEFDSVMAGHTARLRSVAYGQNEGLPRLQASHEGWPGALRSADGRLWIAMQSGLAIVHATEFRQNSNAPPVIIERVTVKGKPVAAYESGDHSNGPASATLLDLSRGDARLRLAPGQNQMEFSFTALSLTMPESLTFKYRLEGFDSDWVEAGSQRIARYPQLPPGDYRFRVKACNQDGIWSQSEGLLSLTAEPLWWQTVWFRIAAPVTGFGLVGGLTVVALRRRHRRQIELLEMQKATERERARIAQDLHDDLGAGLTQISLNTAMVQNPAVTPEIAGGLLLEIDQRARELVNALDEIVWAVNPKNDTIPSLARYLCQFAQACLLPADIACRLEVDPDLPATPLRAEQRHNLFLAFKEALHNSLRHSRATELTVKIHTDTDSLAVSLSDNGKGFVPGKAQEGADGLGNMQTRMQRLGGSCLVSSAVGRGTTVTLRLPLNPKDHEPS